MYEMVVVEMMAEIQLCFYEISPQPMEWTIMML